MADCLKLKKTLLCICQDSLTWSVGFFHDIRLKIELSNWWQDCSEFGPANYHISHKKKWIESNMKDKQECMQVLCFFALLCRSYYYSYRCGGLRIHLRNYSYFSTEK